MVAVNSVQNGDVDDEDKDLRAFVEGEVPQPARKRAIMFRPFEVQSMTIPKHGFRKCGSRQSVLDDSDDDDANEDADDDVDDEKDTECVSVCDQRRD